MSHLSGEAITMKHRLTHLTALLLAMAPAALQGYWTHRGSRPAEEPPPKEAIAKFLIDTCRVWRKGGPLAGKLK